MISKRIAENVIEAAMATGGDFAEIFMEDTRKNNVSLTDGKLETAAANRIHGAGIRVFNGLNSVYVYTNDTGEEGLIRSARQAAQASASAPAGKPGRQYPSHIGSARGCARTEAGQPGASRL